MPGEQWVCTSVYLTACWIVAGIAAQCSDVLLLAGASNLMACQTMCCSTGCCMRCCSAHTCSNEDSSLCMYSRVSRGSTLNPST